MTPYQFFLRNAGYSWNPCTETREQGRRRTAHALADAERRGSSTGLAFSWEVDHDQDSSQWSDDAPPYDQWLCTCWDTETNRVLSSLGCIDFGRAGSPYSEPYRRIVEAELAAEALA